VIAVIMILCPGAGLWPWSVRDSIASSFGAATPCRPQLCVSPPRR